MYKENLEFFLKHYGTRVQKETQKNQHHLIRLDMNYLPVLKGEGEETDAGQHDHLLDF